MHHLFDHVTNLAILLERSKILEFHNLGFKKISDDIFLIISNNFNREIKNLTKFGFKCQIWKSRILTPSKIPAHENLPHEVYYIGCNVG